MDKFFVRSVEKEAELGCGVRKALDIQSVIPSRLSLKAGGLLGGGRRRSA